MKVTLDLVGKPERDMIELGRQFGSLDNAFCAALAMGAALLLKTPELVEKAKALHRKPAKKTKAFAE